VVVEERQIMINYIEAPLRLLQIYPLSEFKNGTMCLQRRNNFR
jgi:hypothetical protein